MSDADQLIELLAEWEDKRRTGPAPTPEELCPEDPTLRERLRLRIQRRIELLKQIDPPTVPGDDGPTLTPALPCLAGYEFQGVLGSGGMGIVYKARHIALDRIVAVKMVLAGPGSSSGDLARFRSEAQTVAHLQHPNIVQVHDVGEYDGRPYLTLEYVDGGSLAHGLRGHPLPPDRAATILRTLAEAVQHAHEKGVIHRDLKPANVLLAADGTPKIADFGLAKRLDNDRERTRPGTVMGTPNYMAPEQSLGRSKDIGPATDVFALGVMLYEMLTGRLPFAGATFLDTLEQIRSHDPVAPRDLIAKIPRDLETICLKCLHKDPKHRYATAGALARDLQRFLDGEAIEARAETFRDQVVRALVRSKRDFPHYAHWSRVYFCVAPFPALIHIAVTALFMHQPYFPFIALPISLATAMLSQLAMFRGIRSGVEALPSSLRRHTRIVWNAITVANFLVTLGMWWRCPSDQPEFLLLVYPIMATMVGLVFFALAAEIGWAYVTGVLAFLMTGVLFVFPRWAPLFVGLLMTFNMASFGFFFRHLARELKDTETTPIS